MPKCFSFTQKSLFSNSTYIYINSLFLRYNKTAASEITRLDRAN